MAKATNKTSAAKVAEVTPEQQAARILELEAALDAKTKENEALTVSNATVLEEKETLEAELTANKDENANLVITKEEKIKELEEALNKTLEAIPETSNIDELEVEVEVVEKKRPIFENENGQKFTFTKRAPKNLKILGTVFSLEELVKNKEAMEFLIIGNSSFVEQIN